MAEEEYSLLDYLKIIALVVSIVGGVALMLTRTYNFLNEKEKYNKSHGTNKRRR